MKHIIISEGAMSSGEAANIVYSNVTFVNLLLEEDMPWEQIHPDALASYYLDYYDSQYRNGNFSQFVYNSGWDADVNSIIEKGLEQIKAPLHLQLFREQVAVTNSLTRQQLEQFLDGGYFGENPLRNMLKNDRFFQLQEDISELNAAWLINHPDIKVLSIDGMYEEAEKLVGRMIERD